jgi:uncharacterized RDD family membrane protein YckC
LPVSADATAATFPATAAAIAETSLRAPADSHEAETPDPEEASAWRGELSAKLNRYRSKRKIRPPRYPSLSLPFDAVAPSTPSYAAQVPAEFEPLSDRALALDSMVRISPAAERPEEEMRSSFLEPQAAATPTSPHDFAHGGAKIIEFPGFAWGPPVSPPDQLAEPVMGRPRILDVPEEAAPLPALGGITIDAVEKQESEKRPGIDLPLQSAPMAMRMFAAGIDGLIVVVASGLFAFIFWKIAAIRPPRLQLIGLAVGIPCLFWAVYQYLLLVYAASSPGLRVAGLELTRFDGGRTTRKLRLWRVLASYLSAVSIGMGYAWIFLDEDSLCWHDRITHTYLAPKATASNGE